MHGLSRPLGLNNKWLIITVILYSCGNPRESREKFSETLLLKCHQHQLAQNLKDSQSFKFMPWRWQAMANCV